MSIRKLRPTTPGQRFRAAPDFSELTKKKPERSLLLPVKRTGGRNNTGKMTMRYRGGGHKRRLRIIDFKRKKYDIPGVVKAIEYDPMRTAYIALLHYVDGEKAYILAPEGLKVGDKVLAGQRIAPEVGHALPLKNMPAGTTVHNVELHPGRGGAMARSAGASAQLVAKAEKYVTLKLPSGERRLVLGACMATVGTVSNGDHMNAALGKAGRNRWLGRRPRVRGVAMNPVDHPMGGGEGKASGGHPRSRKGLYAKGKRTRNDKKYSQELIISRRKK
ncbi:MAG: 50S ribosomal protein L2 [Amoebophilaceae bacterium]|jgi:large subunit ribosomal protein L2|nr:50S ribosomal protein L2 [Amoebophilaceae bacterium]